MLLRNKRFTVPGQAADSFANTIMQYSRITRRAAAFIRKIQQDSNFGTVQRRMRLTACHPAAPLRNGLRPAPGSIRTAHLAGRQNTRSSVTGKT